MRVGGRGLAVFFRGVVNPVGAPWRRHRVDQVASDTYSFYFPNLHRKSVKGQHPLRPPQRGTGRVFLLRWVVVFLPELRYILQRTEAAPLTHTPASPGGESSVYSSMCTNSHSHLLCVCVCAAGSALSL